MILHVDADEGGRWLIRSDASGEARAEEPPWRRDELFPLVLEEFQHLAGSPAADRDFENVTHHALRLGSVLTAYLLPAEIEQLQSVAREGKTPLLAIESASHEVLSLPWELLRIGNRWVVRDGWLDVVRSVPSPEAAELPIPDRPVTLFVNVSAPAGSTLDYEKESHAIALATQGNVDVVVNHMGEVEDLLSALRGDDPPTAVHFSGHGGPLVLVFENDRGRASVVPIRHLTAAMRNATGGRLPHLFYLASCFGADVDTAAPGAITSTAAELHGSGIAQVVAHVGPVPDAVATRVATAFYRAVGAGRRTTEAIREARGELWNEVTAPFTWTLLVLYHRGPDVPLGIPERVNGRDRHTRPTFIGRRREMHRLRSAVDRGRISHLVHGLAGAGKSTFCEAALAMYRSRGWQQQIVTPFDAARLEEIEDLLREGHRVLVYLDDLDAESVPIWSTLVALSERHPRTFALLASSREHPERSPPVFPLPPMSRDEIARMIGWHRALRQLQQESRDVLASEVAGLPRAVHVASEVVAQRLADPNRGIERWTVVEPALREVQKRFVRESNFDARWQRLDGGDKRFLISVSVLRRPAVKELVLALADETIDAERSFERLRRSSLLITVPGDDRDEPKYYVHPFVDRAATDAYEDPDAIPEIAEDAHAAAGKWLEALTDDLAPEAEEAAYHLLRGGYIRWSFAVIARIASALTARHESTRAIRLLRPYFVQPTYRYLEEDGITLEHDYAFALKEAGRFAEALPHAERARRRLEEELSRPSPRPDAERQLRKAFEQIGLLQQALGNRPAALRSFQRALALGARVAAANPDNLLEQRAPSFFHDRIGDIHRDAHDYPAALESYRAALAIAERLIERDPDTMHWQRDLAISHRKIGQLLEDMNDAPALEQSYREALAVALRMADAHRENRNVQRDVSLAYNELGDLYVRQGRLPEALALFEKALQIRIALVDADPRNVAWQHDLANAYKRLADVASDRDASTLALQYLQQALRIEQAHGGPGDPPRRCAEMLASIHRRLAIERMLLVDLDAGAASFRAALRLRTRLAAMDPANAEARHDELLATIDVIDAESDRGQFASAERLAQEALVLARGMAAQHPDNAMWQRALGSVWKSRGHLQLQQNAFDAAAESFAQALAIARRAEDSFAVASALTRIGELHRKRGDRDRARESYEAALAVHRDRAAAEPENASRRVGVASACMRVAQVADGELARRLCEEALQIRGALLAADPANASHRFAVLEARIELAATAEELADIETELEALVALEPRKADWQMTLAETRERIHARR